MKEITDVTEIENEAWLYTGMGLTLRTLLSGTFLQRKDVVNQCLEFDGVFVNQLGDGGSRRVAKARLDCAKKKIKKKWQPNLAFDLMTRCDLAQ